MTEVVRILESVLEYQSVNSLKTFTMETRSQYLLPDARPSSSVVNSIKATNPELAGKVENTDLFEMYFKIADLDRDERINDVEAVPFFQTSGLPKAILSQIWAYVDVNRSGYLNRPEFDNYLKLVTIAQSKQELTPDIVKAALYGPDSTKIAAPQIDLEALAVPQLNLKTRSKNPLLDTVPSNSTENDINPSHTVFEGLLT
ncbi:unnamed protein product [Lactuca virosa]|uniref:EH domain-containing protein n=1 Tax=Lactuca virosa TaxID=75947 RepID=A0AAU9N015_9ASTR|nr:unnamed protein product [Lactuca virosa]